MFKSDFLVRTLKNMGKSREEIRNAAIEANFNMVCFKLADKKYFEGVDVSLE